MGRRRADAEWAARGYLTVPAAAAFANVAASTMYRWIAAGHIKCVKSHAVCYVARKALIDFAGAPAPELPDG